MSALLVAAILAGFAQVPAATVPEAAAPVVAPADAPVADETSPEDVGEDEAPAPVPSHVREASELLRSFVLPSGAAGTSGVDAKPLGEAHRAALESPVSVSNALAPLLRSDHGRQFLRDVDWRIRTFDADGETGLGLAFNYARNVPLDVEAHADGRGVTGFGLDLTVDGNVAFDDEVNPTDFLSSRLTVDWFRSRGGTRGALTSEQQQTAVTAATAASNYADRDEWLASPEWNELTGLAREVLSTQVYCEFGLDFAFESDQSFGAQDYVVGAHAAFDVKVWNDHDAWTTLNFVDYPAALVRVLTGFDRELTPRGHAFPTLVVGFEHVEPDGDTPRALAGDDSDYRRLRLELAYKAPLATIDGEQYALTAVYRRYHELDPSDEVEAADLDEYDYVTFAFESEQGLYASFATGRMPFDDEDAEVYALGWRFQF